MGFAPRQVVMPETPLGRASLPEHGDVTVDPLTLFRRPVDLQSCSYTLSSLQCPHVNEPFCCMIKAVGKTRRRQTQPIASSGAVHGDAIGQ